MISIAWPLDHVAEWESDDLHELSDQIPVEPLMIYAFQGRQIHDLYDLHGL